MKNTVAKFLLIIAFIVAIGLGISPKARALVENQVVGFFGVTPVSQQPASTDLLLSFQHYGLIGTGTAATPLNLNNGALQVGSLTIGGTSYGGSIQAATFVTPTVTGTMTISDTVTGGTFTGSAITAPTIASETLSGTQSGTVTDATTKTITGTTTIAPAGALVLSGTAHPAGSIIVSGTTIKLYITGTTGITFTGAAF